LTFVYGSLENEGVHVMVVCVAQYEHPSLPNKPFLKGAVLSAERLVDFWQSEQLPEGKKLGSIRLFLSCSSDAESRYKESAEPADQKPIVEHLRALMERGDPEGLAIIHWIGHGATYGDDGGELRGVFYADQKVHNNGTDPRGLSMSHVLRAFSRQASMPLLMTVDACATPPDVKCDHFDAPLGSALRGTPTRVRGIYAAAYPEPAICTLNEIAIEGGKKGGSLFSEAVRISLEGFAAEKRGSRPPMVYEEGLLQAVKYHHDRLLRKRGYESSEPSEDGRKFDRRMPITMPAIPRGVVQVCTPTNSGKANSEYVCAVTGQLLDQELLGEWCEDEDSWEVLVAQDHTLDDDSYRACLRHGERVGAAKNFSALRPITEVDVEFPS